MSGEGTLPFDPTRIAALGRLSAEINGSHAPPPIRHPVVVTSNGFVTLPVPDHVALGFVREGKYVSSELHAGMTLQWAPMVEAGGLLVEFRGGAPDGDENRDAVAVFLTRKGLAGLIADLQAIDAALGGAA